MVTRMRGPALITRVSPFPGPRVSDDLPTPGSGSGGREAQHRSVLHSVTPGPLLTPETPRGSELLLRNAITLGKLT